MERNLAERLELEDGLRRLGIAPAESQANFVWFDLPAGRRPTGARWLERGSSTASPSAACSCARARALGRPGALRVTVGTRHGERALPGGAGRRCSDAELDLAMRRRPALVQLAPDTTMADRSRTTAAPPPRPPAPLLRLLLPRLAI